MKMDMFSIRVTDEQKRKIQRAAHSRSMPPTIWARRTLLAAIQHVDISGVKDDVRPQAGRPPRLADIGAAA